jgi:hypothetical protein
MIRFVYNPKDLDPRDLHRRFLQAGAAPRLYSCRPRPNQWSLCIDDPEEAEAICRVLSSLRTPFTTKEVPCRFSE